jgi:hypothetical protein
VITSDINYGTQCRQNCNMTSLNKICLALLCVFQPSCHVVLDRPACKSQASSSSLHLLASNARNFSINVAATATAAHTTPAVTSKVKLAALLLTRGEMGCLRFKFKLHSAVEYSIRYCGCTTLYSRVFHKSWNGFARSYPRN